MQILGLFFNRCFHSLERLVFFLEHLETLFIRIFCPERKDEEPKKKRSPWTKPSGKMQILRLFYGYFHSLDRLVFFLERHQTLFLSLFLQ